MTEARPRIGFIGLGLMGAPMCKNLLKAGYHVTALDKVAGKTDQLVKDGVKRGLTPKQVAQESDVVITMVPDSPDVEEVVLGPDGVIHGVRPGSIFIDMSTISPAVTRRISARLKEKGMPMLDAPVSGGVAGAAQATLVIMVGGDEAAFNRVLPILQTMGKKVNLMGASGAGQVTKLVNQIMVAVNLTGVAEALMFASKAGADLTKTVEAVRGGGASSYQLDVQAPKIISGNFAPGFMIRHMLKDLRLILEVAEEMNLPLPLTSLASQLYRAVAATAGAEQGTQAVITALERLGGGQARQPSQG